MNCVTAITTTMADDVPSFEELFLPVSDLGRSRAFYRDGLGLRVAHEGDDFLILRGAGGPRILLHEAGGDRVVPGKFEMEIRVHDVDRCFQELSRSGVRIRREPFEVTHEGDPWSPRRETRLADPDGYGVVLFSPKE